MIDVQTYLTGAAVGVAATVAGRLLLAEWHRYNRIRGYPTAYGPLGEPRAVETLPPRPAPGFRAPRLTVVQAEALDLPHQRIATPWAIGGETAALLPHDRLPCQVCWHPREAHSIDHEDDFMCLRRECACPGYDGFLDTA